MDRSTSQGNRLSRWERQEFIKLSGLRCAYCGRVGNRDGLDDLPWHIDHAQPLSRGGEHTPGNLRLACERCNAFKGAATLDELPGRIAALQRHLAWMLGQQSEWAS